MSAPVMRHGTVTALLSDGKAQIVSAENPACSGNCADCHSCSANSGLCFSAVNTIGAKPGDRVTAEGRLPHQTRNILFRLLIPAAAFALGCVLANALSDRDGIVAGVGVLCMLLGCVLYAKMKRRQDGNVSFVILSIDG